MARKRKFFLTTITVEVLTEGAPLDSDMTLEEVDSFLGQNDGAGRIRFTHYPVAERSIVGALKEWKIDPNFFRTGGALKT